MIVMESAFDLKGKNLKLAEKSRIIPALAHEVLVALYCMYRYWIYSMQFSLYDSVSYCIDYCFLFNFPGFYNLGATLQDFNLQIVWEDVNNYTNNDG